MQCLHLIQHHHGKMEMCAIVAALNFHLRNENIIVVIADKSFVHNVQVKLVHCQNLASKRRFVHNLKIKCNIKQRRRRRRKKYKNASLERVYKQCSIFRTWIEHTVLNFVYFQFFLLSRFKGSCMWWLLYWITKACRRRYET